MKGVTIIMEFFNQIVQVFKDFGGVEWFMLACIVVLVVALILFNKGCMIAQRKLNDYEGEIRTLNGEKSALLDTIDNLTKGGNE